MENPGGNIDPRHTKSRVTTGSAGLGMPGSDRPVGPSIYPALAYSRISPLNRLNFEKAYFTSAPFPL
jgi:hypothetical protein